MLSPIRSLPRLARRYGFGPCRGRIIHPAERQKAARCFSGLTTSISQGPDEVTTHIHSLQKTLKLTMAAPSTAIHHTGALCLRSVTIWRPQCGDITVPNGRTGDIVFAFRATSYGDGPDLRSTRLDIERSSPLFALLGREERGPSSR